MRRSIERRITDSSNLSYFHYLWIPKHVSVKERVLPPRRKYLVLKILRSTSTSSFVRALSEQLKNKHGKTVIINQDEHHKETSFSERRAMERRSEHIDIGPPPSRSSSRTWSWPCRRSSQAVRAVEHPLPENSRCFSFWLVESTQPPVRSRNRNIPGMRWSFSEINALIKPTILLFHRHQTFTSTVEYKQKRYGYISKASKRILKRNNFKKLLCLINLCFENVVKHRYGLLVLNAYVKGRLSSISFAW